MPDETERMTLTDEVREAFASNLQPAGNAQDCWHWRGPRLQANRENGYRRPVIVSGDEVYTAAVVGVAIKSEMDTIPKAHFRPQVCGDWECVKPTHVVLMNTNGEQRLPQVAKRLQDTEHYAERYAYLKEWLTENPNTPAKDLNARLKQHHLGGKNEIVYAIIREVRHDLNLPARIEYRRRTEAPEGLQRRRELVQAIKQYRAAYPQNTVDEFIQQIRDMREVGIAVPIIRRQEVEALWNVLTLEEETE